MRCTYRTETKSVLFSLRIEKMSTLTVSISLLFPTLCWDVHPFFSVWKVQGTAKTMIVCLFARLIKRLFSLFKALVNQRLCLFYRFIWWARILWETTNYYFSLNVCLIGGRWTKKQTDTSLQLLASIIHVQWK